jgi:ribA/ribD-fused uncharacterized protein
MSGQSQILFYESQHYYLSNFSAFAVRVRRETWMTVEHAYQARKFPIGIALSARQSIFRAMSAHDAKQVAKANKHLVRAGWDEIKLKVMEELIRLKFDQHEFVRKMLLSTGDAELVEDSPKDSFWGRGPDWKGQNHLGRLWMKIRDEMQK